MHWEIHFLKNRDNIARGHDEEDVKNRKDWEEYDKQNAMANLLSKDSVKYSARQRTYFVLGIVFFVIWRFFEMYLITITSYHCS